MKTEIELLREQLNSISEQIKALESKPKLEVGDYIITHLNSVATIITLEDDGVRWDDVLSSGYKNGQTNFGTARKATPKEIEEALIKEGDKKYPVGTKINKSALRYVTNRYIDVVNGGEYRYNNNNDTLMRGDNTIYSNGKWAEIIKDEVIKIGGHEVKFKSDGYKGFGDTFIDDYHFSKQFWQAAKLISEHNKAKIMVGCSKQFDVSLETINAILSKL